MSPLELRKILLEQAKSPITSEHLTKRTALRRLEELEKTDLIIILTGIRRCGKSTLLQMMRSHHDGHYVNFDDERFIHFGVEDFQKMYEILVEIGGDKRTFYFDEIQNIPIWERFVRRLHDEGKKIFITGSNASMLSKELGTHLTGRYLQLDMFPFSFQEYLLFKGIEQTEVYGTANRATLKSHFNEYMEQGGLPPYLQSAESQILKAIFDNVIYRDVVARHGLSQIHALRELVHFIAGNVAKEISYNSLKTMLGLGNATTVKEYLMYLEDSYMLFLVPRFYTSLRKQTFADKKVYFIDTALARTVGFRASDDTGRFLENIVFLELRGRGNELFYFKKDHECDFVMLRKTRAAIQVCYELTESNRQRELDGLIEAMKAFQLDEGTILTYDQEEEISPNKKKIHIRPVWKWLLEPPESALR